MLHPITSKIVDNMDANSTRKAKLTFFMAVTCAKQNQSSATGGETKKTVSQSRGHISVLLIYDWPFTASIESREDAAESCDDEDGAETDSELKVWVSKHLM